MKDAEQIVIYSRKSKFTGKGESIENQIEMCKQYIRLQFGGQAANSVLVYEDEGFSGGTLERPQFKKMMAEAREKEFRAIVVYRLDRISRNIGDFAKLIEKLNGMKIDFISIDGKTKKACKLKTVPEEIALVKLIFDKFLETGSLTKTETYLLQNGYATKNGNQFTRFAIKGLLSNPVYLISDEFAYDYLKEKNVDLFSDKSEFDGIHGIMAYNRTLQQPGKAHQIKPMDEWIVSVGRHEGAIEGAAWVKVQRFLERNKSKSYRNPRGNAALLSGLLICGGCGGYMRPKASQRVNAKGETIYTYLCSTKERSRCHICNMKNCSGNILDADIIEQLKSLNEDSSEFFRRLEHSKRALLGSRQEYDGEIAQLKSKLAENGDKIKGLVSALGKASGTSAEGYIMGQIDELHNKGESLRRRLAELEELTSSHALPDIEFDLLAQMLVSFKSTIDGMTVEQKRTAIRAFVKQIIWDGTDVHVILFGSNYEYKFPEAPVRIEKAASKSDEKGSVDKTAEGGNAEPSGEHSK